MLFDANTLASGMSVAGRYELRDLVSETLGASNWRAHDGVLNRNVRVEVLPSQDPRAEHFLQAARESTTVTDHRFLRVLDLFENESGHHVVIREWARAYPLSSLLLQSPLPNRRAATVVAEVAEAFAQAHDQGIYHRRLTPHHVLLKESGAVRIVGLGVAKALAPVDQQDSDKDLRSYEIQDVQSLGKLLYACLVARWPGIPVDGLRAAPSRHGTLLRPRQVRAGVSRDVDTVCDRILGLPPRHHETPLTRAGDIAHVLRMTGEDEDLTAEQPSLSTTSSPDLLRLDPFIEPTGPPPGLEPPRRRPKAFEPPPPSLVDRTKAQVKDATKGPRALVLLGIVMAFVIGVTLTSLVTRFSNQPAGTISAQTPVSVLPIEGAYDFDPQGADGEENPDTVHLAFDGLQDTGWTTSTYYRHPQMGRLKSGVGIVVDLGTARQVEQVQLRLAGSPNDISILTAPSTMHTPPNDVYGLREVGSLDGFGEDATIAITNEILTRYVVIWLRSLPPIGEDEYRGEIREVVIRGR